MQTIECWKLETISGAEGEYIGLEARFSSKEEAEKALSGFGGYGGQVSRETITIFHSAVEWKPALDHESRLSGLAKLSVAEKAALGLER